jgi:hypothetical protein
VQVRTLLCSRTRRIRHAMTVRSRT